MTKTIKKTILSERAKLIVLTPLAALIFAFVACFDFDLFRSIYEVDIAPLFSHGAS